MSILDKAIAVVGERARRGRYGHPYDDFNKVSGMLTSLFKHKLKPGEAFGPEDIPLIQILIKLAREVEGHAEDNLVDIAGYARTCELVVEEKERRGIRGVFTDLTEQGQPRPIGRDDVGNTEETTLPGSGTRARLQEVSTLRDPAHILCRDVHG